MDNVNLDLWEKVREVPKTAQKEIKGGRLVGKTDINPVWRLNVLTENFGKCGIGWKYEIVRFWNETGANNTIASFAEIKLYIKDGGTWSEPIPGVGGNMFVAKESGGLYTSDECYKMALTDAISVACKALGIGADVYWNENTKYDKEDDTKKEPEKKPEKETIKKPTEEQKKKLEELGGDLMAVAKWKKKWVEKLTFEDVQAAIEKKLAKLEENKNADKQT